MSVLIPLSKGFWASVDEADAALAAHRWHVSPSGPGRLYARRFDRALGRVVYLHRVVTGAHEGIEVDHINGDGLDNRRSNLRLCTSTENKANSRLRKDNRSGFKGVRWHRASGRWVAEIQARGQRFHLGLHDTPEAAARAYEAAAGQLFGAFARPTK